MPGQQNSVSDRERADAPCCNQLLSDTEQAAGSCTQISSLLVGLLSKDMRHANLNMSTVLDSHRMIAQCLQGLKHRVGQWISRVLLSHWSSSLTVSCSTVGQLFRDVFS